MRFCREVSPLNTEWVQTDKSRYIIFIFVSEEHERCRDKYRERCFVVFTNAKLNGKAIRASVSRLLCPPKFDNIHERRKGFAVHDGEQSGSFNINTGLSRRCAIVPSPFSVYLATLRLLAAVGQTKKGKVKVVFIYSAVSSPSDRSKRFTLFAFPDRPVHSDTVIGFSGKHSSQAAITRQD